MVPDGAAVQRRVLRVLSASQVLGGIAVATGISVSALLGASLSGSGTVGGLAQTASVLGAAVLSLPVARLAARAGRRPALVTGYGVATVGALAAALAVAAESWPFLLLALVAFGGGTTAGLAARYGATDLARQDRRARDLSVVVWATTVGSVAGPNLAEPAQRGAAALGLTPDAGPYLLSAVAFGLAALLVGAALRPDPLVSARSGGPGGAAGPVAVVRGAGWRALRASRGAQLAVAAIVVSHTVMVGLMVMTPVHMDTGGASLRLVGVVISLHIAGMYALSPLIGWLADRAGRVPVLALGAALLVGSAAVVAGAPPSGAGRLSVGLVLLGVGWSCGLVAGSALLTELIAAPVRPQVQGLSDLAMNGGAALGGVAAGVVVALTSYAALAVVAALAALPLLVAASAAAVRPRAA